MHRIFLNDKLILLILRLQIFIIYMKSAIHTQTYTYKLRDS